MQAFVSEMFLLLQLKAEPGAKIELFYVFTDRKKNKSSTIRKH